MKHKLLLCLLFLSISVFAQKPKKCGPDAVGNVITEYNYQVNKKYKGYTKQSFYLTMRDSVKLAVDLYLPKGLEPGTKIPVLLYQTRYWRSVEFRALIKPFMGDRMPGMAGKLMSEMISTGYAVIGVDTRGTGASFGRCNYPWSADEIKDGAEIIDWAIKQPWCSGKFGSLGISYSGTTAEMLLVNQHPAVKAIVPMFSLYDAYDDIAIPNGIQFRWFTSNWGDANTSLDNNKLPRAHKAAKLFIKGVDPVDGKGRRKLLKAAIASHKDNISVHDGVLTIRHRDDVPLEGKYMKGIDVFSPHAFKGIIDSAGAAIYNYSGWFDGDYQHAAIKRFLNLTTPGHKLIIGPWEHGGYVNLSPTVNQMGTFDKASELLKFFDYHLKGMPTGVDAEPKVYYYTMVEDKWKAAQAWPPKANMQTVYLSNNKVLTSTLPEEGFVSYKADTTTGSGHMTRWKALNGKIKKPPVYEEFGTLTPKMACFTGDALTEDMEVTGHGVVNLQVEVPVTEAAFFVYLADVDEKGHIQYVTEGSLNGLYRKIGDNPPFVDCAPYHSYCSYDAAPLSVKEPNLLKFDLLPTSYLFKKGHKLMIAISCADKDHFTPITPHGTVVKILTGGNTATSVELPVVK